MVLPVKTRNTNTGELEKGNDDVFMSVPIPRSVTELASSGTEVEALERKLQRGDLDSTTVHALKELLKA